MNVFCGKLLFVFCMTQSVPPSPKEGKRSVVNSSQSSTSRLLIESRQIRKRRKPCATPATRHLRARRHLGGKPATRFLIADLPIRNGSKPSALNKISVSNRQKKGIFQRPVTYNLKPATCVSNPCPHFGGATTQSETDKGPNSNSQELKTNVTL